MRPHTNTKEQAFQYFPVPLAIRSKYLLTIALQD